MTTQPRVSVITLGVADLGRALAFYEALGWTTNSQLSDGVVFFQSGGMVLALWSRKELAEDCALDDGEGFGGVALSQNVGSAAEVDAYLHRARSAGASITKPGAETFWGGYAGHFTDPDGHPWEIAHNPFWGLDADGAVRLPEK